MTRFPQKRISAVVLVLSALVFNSCNTTPLENRLISADSAIRDKGVQKLATLSVKKQQLLLPKLLPYLKSDDSRIVDRVNQALVTIGSPAVESIAPLIKDPDVYVRLNAVTVLGDMGPRAQNSLPVLLEALKDAHPLVREESLYSIGQIAQNNTSLEPILQPIAKADKSEDVREMAKETIRKLRGEEKRILSAPQGISGA